MILKATTNNLCASNDNQITSCALNNSIGVTPSNSYKVWTGNSSFACNNWTSNSGASHGIIGYAFTIDTGQWSWNDNPDCSGFAGLYCVAQD